MISGVVNTNHEATIRLTVCGASEQEQEIETVIDTGFIGIALKIPSTDQSTIDSDVVERSTDTRQRATAATHC